MKNIDSVHSFCDSIGKKKNPDKLLIVFLAFFGFLLGFLVITLLVIPVFNEKPKGNVVETPLQDSFDKVSSVGNESDPENSTSEAYYYWYAPPNSIGVKEFKTLNYSWFWKVFRKHCDWQLLAWHPVLEEWVDEWQGTNLNEWLNITRTRSNDNGSEKITLNVTNNHPTQDLYFKFVYGIDLRVKDYVNKSSWYEYELTYPANETENYTVMFNFSDVKPLIQNGTLIGKHGIRKYQGDDVFFLSLTQNRSRQPLKSGKSFEIDPTFGCDPGAFGAGSRVQNERIATGGKFTMGVTGGTVQKMTAEIYDDQGGANREYQCGIYDSSGNIIANGKTETIDINIGTYSTEDFDMPVDPTLEANTVYYLLCVSENLAGQGAIRYTANGGTQGAGEYGVQPPLLDSQTIGDTADRLVHIYATYTESADNTAPSQSGESPVNGSTDIAITPSLYVVVNDTDASDTINATWHYNDTTTGKWYQFGSNDSVSSDTNITQDNSNFSNYSSTYYWYVNISDGEGGWNNESYHFTTIADTVTITLVDHMPSNLRTNNIDEAWFLYNITTNDTPIDFYSVVWAYTVNHSLTGTYNTSYSLDDHLAENKLRGINRNVNNTIETKFNDTAGDGSIGGFGEWNTHDGNKNITLVDSGSNWSLVNATEIIAEHLFNTISFVDSEELAIEDKSAQTIEISKTNLIKIDFNMTDTDWYDSNHYMNTSMFFHVYANQTNANKPLDVFYANSSYTTGTISTSPYCELIGIIHQNDPYHFTEYNSSYYELDFIINVTGFVGSVNATSNFSIILCSDTPSAKQWYLHYADDNISHSLGGNNHYHDFDNRTIMTISDDNAVSWTGNSSTPDTYFNYISLDEEDISEVKLYANDTSGNEAWSSVHTDLIDISNYAPDPANIIVPNVDTNYTIGDTIPINYHWIGDPNLDTCWLNITLWDWNTEVQQDWIVNQSITNIDRTTNVSNFTYNWDTTGITASNYTVAINITDPYMLWENSSSNIFYINDTTFQPINFSINGSCTNITTLRPVNYSINGTCTNTTVLTPINWSINGTCTNVSVESFQPINWSINGTAQNITVLKMINSTINGTVTNLTSLNPVNYSINGTVTNLTSLNPVNFSINGTATNTSIESFQPINYSINGSATNLTSLAPVNFSINGTCTNVSVAVFQPVNFSINGTCTNITGVFQEVNSSINGSCTNVSVIPPITFTNEYPSNTSFNAPLQPYLYLTINSTTGLTMNVSWYYGLTQGNENTLLGTDVNITNSTQNELLFQASTYGTNYYWRVMADDGTTYINESYYFTTESDINILPGGGLNPVVGIIGVMGILGFIFFITQKKKKKIKEKEQRR